MTSYRNTLLHSLGGAAAFALVAFAPNCHASTGDEQVRLDLPAQPLGEALRALGLATHRNITADTAELGDRLAPPLSGIYTAESALRVLIAGTGLTYRRVGTALVVVAEERDDLAPSRPDGEITVTGSRIRGAEVTSLVIRSDRESLEAAGLRTMADVARSLPQSFGGGVNPGIGYNVPAANGVDVGGTSSVNLRGLGSDATLTLINGHRAAYNGSRQGIDISAIPLGIVERVEVVPDGGSALYGSDAVAGVVNVLLRPDFDGLETRAQIGGASNGGNFQQQYGAVAGTRWTSGGVVLAYEYLANSAIMSDQRDYTAVHPGLTLLPGQHRHAVAANGHQEIAPGLTFSMDALFNKRWYFAQNPTNIQGDLEVSRLEKSSTSRSLTLGPALRLDLGGSWQAGLSGVYGNERLWAVSSTYTGEAPTSSGFVCYCNELYSVEASGDGALFALPGGLSRVALGAGYRRNLFKAYQLNVANTAAAQGSYYAYGEINLPLLSRAQGIWGVDRLNLSGAIRYERYSGIASVATPKLGIVYAPLADLALKANWGRSFRAPTMYQLHQVRLASLYNAASLGGAGGTALYLTGGNGDLKPEHARTWSASLEYKPRAVPGLEVQVSYFSVVYKDRIVTPIVYLSQALGNAIYADYVTSQPTTSAVQQAVAGAGVFYNYTGAAYDPANVGFIVDNANVNAGRQDIHGIDLLARYEGDIGDWGSLGVVVNTSYLTSHQQLTPEAIRMPLAGRLFNPPHWRSRADVTWRAAGATLNASVSHVGGVTDARASQSRKVAGMTTFDLTLDYVFGRDAGPLSGVSLNLSAQNLFNARPDAIVAPSYYETAYDTTNYSAIGRFLSIGVTKSW
ncbi:TonB-dependent receptor [Novosphingobium kaempferiae]|uniref:TonB-dependent receptor n=1 Tax=Novosphingobium kaempferiae TaxID=2896849 RepID=UPI001E52A9CD|nr:TonB-dependent receptor [Novosphingobium kaempferiae]